MVSMWQKRGLSWVLVISLSAIIDSPVLAKTMSVAQNNPATGVLMIEGFSLFKEGSENSLRKAREKFTQVLRTTDDSSQRLEALVINGLISNKLKDYKQALVYFSDALPLSRKISDRSKEAMAFFGIGIANIYLGQRSNALDNLKQSLVISRALKDTKMAAQAQDMIDSINNSTLSTSPAVKLIDEGKKLFAEGSESSLKLTQQKMSEAIKICQAEGDKSCLLSSLMIIGVTSEKLGANREALEYYSQALSLSRESGKKESESILLFRMGIISLDLKEMKTALSYFEKALPIFRTIGNSEMERKVQDIISKLQSNK